MYDFNGSSEAELSFKKGDEILVVQKLLRYT
jgi:hypothetical protein